MKPDAIARTEAALGLTASSWQAVKSRIGNSRGRWIVRLSGGLSAFVKAPYDEMSAAWLRTEALVYQGVKGGFLPRLLAWDGEVLVLEDLSEAEWPPPWTPDGVALVTAALDELARVAPPDGLPPLTDLRGLVVDSGWPVIQADLAPFLSLGLCGEAWLSASLPELQAAAQRVDLAGTALVHVDIRSDNLCLRDGCALFVDWNQSSVGNARFDLAEWLPSLAAEGGPLPEQLMPEPDAAQFASALAGLWGARATLPSPPQLPGLRELQRMQAAAALAWSARALGLPPPR